MAATPFKALLALLTIALIHLTLTSAQTLAPRIKSISASGTGCPAPRWVQPGISLDSSNIYVWYWDMAPEISPQHLRQFAVKDCEVVLELDQLPAGKQFAVRWVNHTARVWFEQGKWEQRFVTELRFNDDSIYLKAERRTDYGRDGSASGLVDVVASPSPSGVWSPCFRDSDTLKLTISERAAIGWNGDLREIVSGNHYAWFATGDFAGSYRGYYGLNWRTCSPSA